MDDHKPSNDLAADLGRELVRLTRLSCLGGPHGALARRPPSLTLRAATRERTLAGRASFRRHEITVIEFASTTRADMLATLLHELVHFAQSTGRHDASFKSALVLAAREGYGVDVSAYERGPYRDLDRALERELAWKAAKALAASMWVRVAATCQVSFTPWRTT